MNINWYNVKLIFSREVRDQLRDRRTLFMVAVLPLLLYPLMGVIVFQMGQYMQEHPVKVLIVGGEGLPETPSLIVEHEGQRRFAGPLFREAGRSDLLDLHFLPAETANEDPAETARQLVKSGKYQVAVVFPPDFGERLAEVHARLSAHDGTPQGESATADVLANLPSPTIHYNAAREASSVAFVRVSDVLDRWTAAIGRQNLSAGGVPERAARPFDVSADNVARQPGRGSALYAKVLPFMLLIWALTGAFYPAVDLCAGEKERGTLETLLSSPAQRGEIVVGKLFTIMAFSVATALLNLASMGVVGRTVLSQLPDLGSPPALAPLWLVLTLIPVSALFSAVCLALAAFARSTKEGQYYLMPVLLIVMPLAMLPMLPGFELNLGNSLIPVSGVVLLLRTLLEGASWDQVLPYVPPVTAVTCGCCWLAVRWAIDQFNSESVLFRESEQFGLGLWLRHLLRDREDTPGVAAALACGVLILVIRFFMGFALPQPEDFRGLAVLVMVTAVVVVLSPALLMTVMLTRSPRQTLLLSWPKWWGVPAAVMLAVALQPTVNLLFSVVMRLYPVSEAVTQQLQKYLDGPLWLKLLALAAVPALAEELAFRGFILSGLRRSGNKWRAIAVSSLFFGLAHGIFQQSLIASILGMVIGYLAVQTGSLLPCICFHFVHNSIGVLTTRLDADFLAEHHWLGAIFRESADGSGMYQPHIVALSGLIVLAILYGLHRQQYAKTPEERLHETIDQAAAYPAGM
ncbi:MAG: ABC transporter permease subunit/CPBP intramembrane protease [Pirellulales bacterium]